MSNTIRKIRLPSGNLAVYYDVQPQHGGDPELIRQYGKHLFTCFNGQWVDVRPGYGKSVSPAQVESLSELPIEFDTAPGAAWGIQLWVANRPGLWAFAGPAGGEPYRFETQDIALRKRATLYPGLSDDKVRVIRFGELITQPQLRAEYFTPEGCPSRCMHCGSHDISVKVTDSIDVGVGGGGIPCEEEHHCTNCGETLGQWAYGSFNPAFPETLPEFA